MRLPLTVALFVALGFIRPGRASFSEDSEGSGIDLGGSGSGSGEWSDQGEITSTVYWPNSRDLTFDNVQHPMDFGSENVFMSSSKSFWENQQIVAGVIAGGVTGVVLATALAAILIYNWQKKDDGRYIQGQQIYREDVV